MTTYNLPYPELTKEELGNRNVARENSKIGEQVIYIELSKIQVREGFNVRKDYGDIESLAYSILGNGQEVPGRVDVLADGTFLLTDGHRRFKALQLLEEMGHESPLFRAIVNDRKTTEESRILQMFVTQDNKPLEQYEVAELFQRLVNLGWSQADVARKVGKTAAYVSQMLSFAQEAEPIKAQVRKGNMTVSAAVSLKNKIPDTAKRVEAVEAAVKSKQSNNKSKPVTVTNVVGKKQVIKTPVDLANAIAEMYHLEGDLKPLVKLITSYCA